MQQGQTVGGNEVFAVADHQNAAASVLLAEGGEVGIVGVAREVDHENIEMAGKEGNHAVGEGIPRQEQTGTGLTAGGGFLVGDEKYLLGNIWDGVKNTACQDEFRSCNAYAREECRDCWAKLYCSGGCAANAYNSTGSVNGVYKLGCELHKKRIECAIMIKADEAFGREE